MDKDFMTAISMMSGTSLDAIDACLIKIYKDFSFELLETHSLVYPEEVRSKLLKAANNNALTEDICFLNFVVGEFFAKCALELISKSAYKKEDIDFISSHGQTVFHIPYNKSIADISIKSTLQIGDISVISQKTGILTVGDFRTKDIAAGGLGAPLVPFADELLFKKDKNRAIQNIGGISNVTVLSKEFETFAFDNGPGNMLIDYCAQKFFNLPYDKDGKIASQGVVNGSWLNVLLSEEYYYLEPPKTTGRELFNDKYAENILKSAPENKFDIIATLTNLTAKVIYDSYVNFIFPSVAIDEIVLGGGGAYNITLINYLKNYFKEIKIKTHKDFAIPDKFKEAIAFGFLGYCTLNRIPNNIPSCTGAKEKVIMGKISY